MKDPMSTPRFDIVAKMPEGATKDDVPQMLQGLLAERFGLQMHKETREGQVMNLVVGKGGPKLQKAAGTGEPECQPVGEQGAQFGGFHRACTNLKMSDLAEALPDLAPAYVNKTVVDQTGLTGSYDFRLDWVARANIDTIGGLTMFGAIEKLGLKLEEKKLTLPVVVIDHVEKPQPVQ